MKARRWRSSAKPMLVTRSIRSPVSRKMRRGPLIIHSCASGSESICSATAPSPTSSSRSSRATPSRLSPATPLSPASCSALTCLSLVFDQRLGAGAAALAGEVDALVDEAALDALADGVGCGHCRHGSVTSAAAAAVAARLDHVFVAGDVVFGRSAVTCRAAARLPTELTHRARVRAPRPRAPPKR